MLATLIVLAVCFLAYANGANDNFKGVASLFGSGTASYRTAISWASVTTFAGSLSAIFLAETLVRKFSGKGLVPEALTISPDFLLAVALGAGATVMLATLLGFPISTTHGLTGALVGSGVAAVGTVNVAVVGKAFVLPLLLSPLLAVAVGALVYVAGNWLRGRLGVTKTMCLCAGREAPATLGSPVSGAMARTVTLPSLSVVVDETSACAVRYEGVVLGISASRLLDTVHFLSAGAVSFARGLNDTPKIAALLLGAQLLELRWGLTVVAGTMVIGGLLNARKVAETMSHRITGMNPGQGCAANLSTAVLVTTASLHGLPVSTTHVSVGSLLGMGIMTGQTKWKPVVGILASWVVTLPCAALLGALAYRLIL